MQVVGLLLDICQEGMKTELFTKMGKKRSVDKKVPSLMKLNFSSRSTILGITGFTFLSIGHQCS